jgi:HrpA-like RNA helicase
VLPLYSKLSSKQQQKVFEDSSKRKCIFTTNIAKTSVTIPGIVYIIDVGLVKEMTYNPRARIHMLQVALI